MKCHVQSGTVYENISWGESSFERSIKNTVLALLAQDKHLTDTERSAESRVHSTSICWRLCFLLFLHTASNVAGETVAAGGESIQSRTDYAWIYGMWQRHKWWPAALPMRLEKGAYSIVSTPPRRLCPLSYNVCVSILVFKTSTREEKRQGLYGYGSSIWMAYLLSGGGASPKNVPIQKQQQ